MNRESSRSAVVRLSKFFPDFISSVKFKSQWLRVGGRNIAGWRRKKV